MVKAVFLLVLLAFCQAQDDDKDLADILKDIFGPAPVTKATTNLIDEVTPTQPSIQKLEDTVTEEVYVETYIPPCRTSDGKEGSCTIPAGCTKTLSPNIPSDRGNCTTEEICCAYEYITLSGGTTPVATTPVSTDTKTTCGWKNGRDTRILSDTTDPSEFAEFPWIVVVLQVNPEVFTCSGSIIHPRVVITTAHNVYKTDLSFRVRAGDWDALSTKEELPHQDRNVETVIIHPQFNTKRINLVNDVALLILDKPLNYARHVNAICLPPAGQVAGSGIRCVSAGWGKNNFNDKGAYQAILKKVQLPIIDKTKCQRELRKTRLGPFFKLNRTFMCAGGEANKDTCTGDGGSPLMCPINGQVGRYTATGLVSWGLGCGDTVPAAYADVAVLRPWIDAKMESLGYGTSSYTF